MSEHRPSDSVTDYLDRPPQRWKHEFQRASGSREMVEDRDGEWVKFEDMDLYMFEGGLLMQRMAADFDKMRAALESISKNTCCDTCREAALIAAKALP